MSFVEDTYQPDISRAPMPRNMNRPAPVDPVMDQIRAQFAGQATGAPRSILPPEVMRTAAQKHVLSRNANARPAQIQQLVQQMQSDPGVMDAVLRGAQMDAPQMRGAQPMDQMAPQMRGAQPMNAAPQLRGTFDGTLPQSQAAQPSLRGSLESTGEEAAEGLSSSPEEEAAEAYPGGTNPQYDYTQLDMGGEDEGIDPALAAAIGIPVAGAAYAGYRAYKGMRQPNYGEMSNDPNFGAGAREINPMRAQNPVEMDAIMGRPAPAQLEAPRKMLTGPMPDSGGRAVAQTVMNDMRSRPAPPPTDGTGRAMAQDFVNRQKAPPTQAVSTPAPATDTRQPPAAQPPQKDIVSKINTVMDEPGAQPAAAAAAAPKKARRVAGGLSSPTPDPLGKRPPNIKTKTASAPASTNTMNVKQPKKPKDPSKYQYDAGIGAETAEPYDITQAPKNDAWKSDPRWADDLAANEAERARYKEQGGAPKRAAPAAKADATATKPKAAKAKAAPKAKEPVTRTMHQSSSLGRKTPGMTPAESAAKADADWKAKQAAAEGRVETTADGKRIFYGPVVEPTLEAKAEQVAADSAPKKATRSKATPDDVKSKMQVKGGKTSEAKNTAPGTPASTGMSLKTAKDILAGKTDLKGEELSAAQSRARQFIRLAEEKEAEANNNKASTKKPTMPNRVQVDESMSDDDIVRALQGGNIGMDAGTVQEDRMKLLRGVMRARYGKK